MIEICLSYIKEDMQEDGFDLDQYILFKAIRCWIYKTKVKSEEEKLYDKIYNTKHYILNNEYTKKNLYERRVLENRKKEYEEKIKIIQEQQKEEKRKYAIEYKEELRKNKINKFLNVIDGYSKKHTNNTIMYVICQSKVNMCLIAHEKYGKKLYMIHLY